ncbi:MAG: CehA/McbA family metallohydrolase [Victivallales bacterium]|nr:CehA/McbA family metallohydrolase [Victivallales bacterium]
MSKMTFEERMAHHYSGETREGESNRHQFLEERRSYKSYGLGRLYLDCATRYAGEKTSVALTCKIGDIELQKGDEIKIHAIGYNPFSKISKEIDNQNNPTLVTFNCSADVELTLDVVSCFCKREVILTVISGSLRKDDSIEVVIGENKSLEISEIARPVNFYLNYTKANENFSRLIDMVPLNILANDIYEIECNIEPDVKCNEKSDLAIRLLDKYGNPVDCAANIELDSQRDIAVSRNIELQEGDQGYRKLKNTLEVSTPGCYILKGRDTLSNITFASNPVKCLNEEPEFKLFFGDIHNHDHLSPGLASPREAYTAAMEQGLHFLALPIQTQSGNLTDDKWLIANYMAEQFYKPGEFVTFPSIEWQHYAFGHKVVCFLNPDQIRMNPYDSRYDTSEKLFAELKKSDAFVQVHHTGYKLDCHVPGTDWEYHDEDVQKVLEISSCHGSSEKADSERPLNNPGTGYLQDVLEMGKHIGVIGGSDGHNGRPVKSVREPRKYPGGMACVYAKDLTRQGLFEAFRARRCYGTTGVKMIMEFDINSNPMGSIITCSGKREIKISVAGTNVLEKIEIIKNNDIIFSASSDNEFFKTVFCDDSVSEKEEDSYYLKITQKDGEMGWTSPIWVSSVIK